jgi:uncharacterized protein YeaO (DUF488 family)
MSLRVYTARISYRGTDRLDITRKSAGVDGIAFAPSGRILWPMIALRRSAPSMVDSVWPDYVASYTAEMRASYRDRRSEWDALLERDEVTLVCYCQDHTRCHRTVLAEILVKLGATYAGER